MMNMFNYLKIIGVAILAIIGFMLGESSQENKKLEEELKRKDKEDKDDKELQERIIERDNTSINSKRDWMRSYFKNRNK
jgi:hypothetical protein